MYGNMTFAVWVLGGLTSRGRLFTIAAFWDDEPTTRNILQVHLEDEVSLGFRSGHQRFRVQGLGV